MLKKEIIERLEDLKVTFDIEHLNKLIDELKQKEEIILPDLDKLYAAKNYVEISKGKKHREEFSIVDIKDLKIVLIVDYNSTKDDKFWIVINSDGNAFYYRKKFELNDKGYKESKQFILDYLNHQLKNVDELIEKSLEDNKKRIVNGFEPNTYY